MSFCDAHLLSSHAFSTGRPDVLTVLSAGVQIATFLATFLPLWESRQVLITVVMSLVSCKRADPKVFLLFAHMEGPIASLCPVPFELRSPTLMPRPHIA